MNYKGAIFDIDGTLMDSMKVWDYALARLTKKYNAKEPTDEDWFRYKEMTPSGILKDIVKKNNMDIDFDSFFNEWIEILIDEYEKHATMKEGARDFLKKLKDNGVKIAIATSGFEVTLKAIMEKFDFGKYIDAVAYSSEVGVTKDNPDVYLLAAKRLGVEPTECIVFEDIVAGIRSCNSVGMKTVAVYDYSNRAETEVFKQIADRYIKKWTDLL